MKIDNQSKASQGSIFEYQVSQMFAGLGIFDNITVTQRSNDGGIDILMDGTTPFGDIIKCGVECKDLDVVGRPIIQKLHSAIQMNIKHSGRKYGYVVTSGRFTPDAIEYADIINAEHVNLKIYLINGRELRKLEYLSRNPDSELSINSEDSKGFDSFRNYKYGEICSQLSEKSQSEKNQVSGKITKKISWGSIQIHLLIFFLTFGFTFGIGNILYALYVHYDLKSKLQISFYNLYTKTKSKLQISFYNLYTKTKSKLQISFYNLYTKTKSTLQTSFYNLYTKTKSTLQTSFYNLYTKNEISKLYYTTKDSTVSINEKNKDSDSLEIVEK